MKTEITKILESLVPWKAKVLLAKPGLSQNQRVWTADELSKAAQSYPGKPVMSDHGETCDKLVGITVKAYYGSGSKGEGLYADAIGLMDRDLFSKLEGLPEKSIPPLLKGVSIGGLGNLDSEKRVVDFEPLEWSFTPFPGIPDAQVLELAELKESIQQRRRMIESGTYGPGHTFGRVDMRLYERKRKR